MTMNRVGCVLLGLICAAASGAEAMSEKLNATTSFDLPTQPLGLALKAVAEQAGIQILFEEKVVRGLQAPALKAQESALQALNTLLDNTGLEYAARDETIAVRKKSSTASSQNTATAT